jgi:hypothetical protein
MIHKRRLSEAFPIPTVRTVWLAGLGIVAAIIWGWKGILGFDLGILALCCLDFTMLLRSEKIEVTRHSPRNFSLGDSHDI